MKLALIPPTSLLEDCLQTDYQLLLPRQLDADEDYELAYMTMGARGDFFILDNGAAENDQYSDGDLIEMALHYDVDELAIPDVLGDTVETIRRFNKFFELEPTLAKEGFGVDEGPKLGYVAQGKGWREALAGVQAIMEDDNQAYIHTVYLPRLLVKESGEIRERILLAAAIRQTFGDRLDIHMFGSAPEWPREALAIANEVPFVRGMDTSMPYNWAFKGRALGGGPSIFDHDANTGIQKIGRPTDYFELKQESFDLPLVKQNVRVMHSWTGSTPLPSVKSVL